MKRCPRKKSNREGTENYLSAVGGRAKALQILIPNEKKSPPQTVQTFARISRRPGSRGGRNSRSRRRRSFAGGLARNARTGVVGVRHQTNFIAVDSRNHRREHFRVATGLRRVHGECFKL